MIPFAVVGSDHEYQVNGKRILGRKTKWGTIEGTGGCAARVLTCSLAWALIHCTVGLSFFLSLAAALPVCSPVV